jgi:hypothetical protein
MVISRKEPSARDIAFPDRVRIVTIFVLLTICSITTAALMVGVAWRGRLQQPYLGGVIVFILFHFLPLVAGLVNFFRVKSYFNKGLIGDAGARISYGIIISGLCTTYVVLCGGETFVALCVILGLRTLLI